MNIRKAATLLALFGAKAVVAEKKSLRRASFEKNTDLTEDVEFWTRMTQEMSMPLTRRPTQRPTPRPVANTPVPTFVVGTPAPTFVDTPAPTFINSLPCGLTEDERVSAFTQMALTVTDEATLNNQFSSQSLALTWLIEEDAIEPPICPNVDNCKARERYLMASFYFASGGGKWDQCNAPFEYTPAAIRDANAACNRVVTPFPVNNPRIGATSTNAWLTPVDTCEWGGLACWGTDDERSGCMDQIDFGELVSIHK